MSKATKSSNKGLSRRKALARLSVGVAVAYTAPTILHLDRNAQAVQPSCHGKAKGNPRCNMGKGVGGKGKTGKGGK